jgi:hypothetical protein
MNPYGTPLPYYGGLGGQRAISPICSCCRRRPRCRRSRSRAVSLRSKSPAARKEQPGCGRGGSAGGCGGLGYGGGFGFVAISPALQSSLGPKFKTEIRRPGWPPVLTLGRKIRSTRFEGPPNEKHFPRQPKKSFVEGAVCLRLPQGSIETVCCFDYAVAPPGRRTVNTEPLPGTLVTVTSPPIMRASLSERAVPLDERCPGAGESSLTQ